LYKIGIPVRSLSTEEQIRRNQGEQVVAPNRSLAPTLKSTPPVRGSED
jgi:hypothetical protein